MKKTRYFALLAFSCLFITIFSGFSSPNKAHAAGTTSGLTFMWTSNTTIQDSQGTTYTGPYADGGNPMWVTQYNSDVYYILKGDKETPHTIQGVSSPTVNYLLINKGTPLKAEYVMYDRASTIGGFKSETDDIFDPNSVAPKPLKVINKGNIDGRLVPDDGILPANLGLLNGDWVSLKTSAGYEIIKKEIVDDGSSKWHFNNITISTINNNIHGLYPDRYTLSYYRYHTANCASGDMTVLVDLVCSAELSGSVTFDLKYNDSTNDGSGIITIVGGGDVEQASPANTKSTNSVSADNGINMSIHYKLTSPLDSALASAIQYMGNFVEKTTSWVMSGISNEAKATADIVVGPAGTKNGGMTSPWISIRNIALILLVLALVIIAFANVLQIDIEQYGLNRMIPKIIISIIMAYASWLIFIFFFDFTKMLQDQAVGLIGGTNGLTAMGNLTINTPAAADIGSQIGAILLIIAIFIGILICGIILLFAFIVRIVMLCFLLTVAPLAFILNIMPFASSLYKRWWDEFWKWMFMAPIAMTIIALGSVIAQSASGSVNGQPQFGNVGVLTANSTSNTTFLISLIIFAASIYMAVKIPLSWGGDVMKGWSNLGKKAWGKSGGAALGAARKGIWNATGVPNAIGLAKQKLTYLGDKNSKIAGNRLAQALTGGKLGMSDVAMRQSIEDAEAQNYVKEFKAASLNQKQLRDIVSNSKGPRAMAALQLMADKDWLKEGDLDSVYGNYGVERGDNLLWGNRKKHPTWERDIDQSRSKAWESTSAHKGQPYESNSGFSTKTIMSKLGESDIADIEADALREREVASNLRLTEKTANSLKPEQIDSLTGSTKNTTAL
ncbi:MAG: hypothetical protein Q8912_11670, partial [Bacillota bacterium]|nr:hypothetical protein [Bacillota bacterium]